MYYLWSRGSFHIKMADIWAEAKTIACTGHREQNHLKEEKMQEGKAVV